MAVVALSCDDGDAARATVEKLGLDYPVGHGLEPRPTVDTIGGWWSEEKGGYVQPTGVLLRGERIAQVVQASGPFGRLTPEAVLALTE